MDKKGKDNTDAKSTLQALGFVSGIGIQLAIMIGICIFLGKKIDSYLEISPWGTLFGIIIGFFIGIWTTYKKLLGKQ